MPAATWPSSTSAASWWRPPAPSSTEATCPARPPVTTTSAPSNGCSAPTSSGGKPYRTGCTLQGKTGLRHPAGTCKGTGLRRKLGFSWSTSPGQTITAGNTSRRRFVQPFYGYLRLTLFSRQRLPAFLSIKSLMASAYSALGNFSPLGTFMPSQKISSRLPSGSRK